ncbi:MarR family winged helix-turn-helix transcriptional regulator [uncultured Clostridium sp.]|uniref:MarR family winged helix-turn-helix transcriptional regulator n=1 Tax=uncultured Clostridium sp. TaxID=59620 RepID=UPI00267349F6|nr:MarR family transcriptional regulator [uncultured Clostridium sp.]
MNSIDHIPNNLYILLLSLNRRVFNPNDALKSLNLPSSHAKVLFYLIHNGANPISKVAKDLSISKPNMTPIIDKLVNDGYVERYCDDNDRRVILIKHTKSACNLFKSLEAQVKSNIYNKIKVLDEAELNLLSESIDNILNLIPKIT